MFFAQFWTWLNAHLDGYVGAKTAAIAAAIEPAAVTLGTIYVMAWGFMSMTGRIEEPIWEGVKRILTVGVLLGIGIELWTYNTLVVDTFLNGPIQLASAVVGVTNPVSIIDTIWERGAEVGGFLWDKGGVLSGDVGFYIAGVLVWLIMGFTAVYSFFLLALSKVALVIILTLGPLFIVLLFFDATKRFFEAWIAQLANYGLIAILTSLMAALLLAVVASYATQTAARGAALATVDVLNMILCAGLVLLLMRQAMPIAAGLASGIALSSYGVISGAVNWGMRGARRSTYDFSRGVMDGMRGEPRSRWDSLRRGAGNRVGAGVANAWRGVRGNREGGAVVPRERVMPRPTVRSR